MQIIRNLSWGILSLLLLSCNAGQELSLADTEADVSNGEKIYRNDCALCHAGGIEGAAKLNNSKRWKLSAAKGYEQLVQHVSRGYVGKYGKLPVMGMCPECSQNDIRDAVAYMLVTSGVMK